MEKGKHIYFTQKELSALIDSCEEWNQIMREGEETCETVEERMNNGLGSALRKLYRGRNGEKVYSGYKTVR